MRHRLLIVEEPNNARELSVVGLLASDPNLSCRQIRWNSLLPDSLHECQEHLVVAVTFPQLFEATALFQWLRNHPIATPVLAILPEEPPEGLLQAVAKTADDFVLCPIRKEELDHRLTRLLGTEASDLESTRRRLTLEMGFGELLGNDPVFVRAIEKIPLLASTDVPILITGETGTGKELCARAIHHLGRRCNFPFVPVDCGAVPDHLFENELFGHSRGAFTDAHTDQRGLVALAEKGTLFLDEIDSLSLRAQVKLLRFLEGHTYKPLGAERFSRADVSVIAASNRDLDACVHSQQFRSDLYFRLNVLRLHLPPLRARPRDIPLLAQHFLEAFNQLKNSSRREFTPSALYRLAQYEWPGNVRELHNVVRRASLLSKSPKILPGDLPFSEVDVGDTQDSVQTFREARSKVIELFERVYVTEMLRKHDGNVTQAALEARKDRRAFGRLVKKYSIDKRIL